MQSGRNRCSTASEGSQGGSGQNAAPAIPGGISPPRSSCLGAAPGIPTCVCAGEARAQKVPEAKGLTGARNGARITAHRTSTEVSGKLAS